MSSKVIDKENTSSASGAGKFVKCVVNKDANIGNNTPNPTLLTPKVKGLSLNNINEMSNTGKKRAFGVDLLNMNRGSISIGKTPKASKNAVSRLVNSGTPLAKVSGKIEQEVEDELEPVERFSGSKYDDYADLYDSSLIADILSDMAKNSGELETFNVLEDERKSRSIAKAVRKMTKRANMDSLVRLEIPELDMPMPCILEDSFWLSFCVI